MLLQYAVLQSMYVCRYKAWLLYKEGIEDQLQLRNNKITFPPGDNSFHKIALAAWFRQQPDNAGFAEVHFVQAKTITIRLRSCAGKTEKLLEETRQMIAQKEPPAFFKNKHCPECPYWQTCYAKLKERDCISLLGGISPTTISQYNKRGIFSITQLSHLFRPRRRGRQLSNAKFLWELKALALREQKTYVLQPPDLIQHGTYIYLDFEGLPDEHFQYLLGGVIRRENKEDYSFSFWADTLKNEETQFIDLIKLLNQYPEASICHYSSYETAAFKRVAKKYGGLIKQELPALEKRMVDLLGFLRTHVYPPTYGNGLKEVAGYLQFQWQDKGASGLQSISWRKEWEETWNAETKEKLIRYNLDDAGALAIVHQWLLQLAKGANKDHVQEVAKMKRHTPYNLQSNKEYSADFQLISKAAYFDYQRNKVYWRSNRSKAAADITQDRKPPSIGKGIMRWKPKKVNEVVVIPPLRACPHCGHTKLYNTKKQTAVKQTDLRFTASGTRQHVIEYRAGKVKCASSKCYKKSNNANLRIRHYGDNLFAYVTYLYLNFNISNELVSRLVQEQFGIYMSQMYLVMNKHKWWKLWNPEVDYIKRIVLNSPVIHVDETSVKLDNDRGYVWVFATPHSVFYHLTLTREAEFLHELLKDYKGILITDFYPGYETLAIPKQKCLIHLIRDLNDDLFKNPFDEEYKNFVSAFSKLLKEIIQTIDKYGLKKRNLGKHIAETETFRLNFLESSYKSELANKYTKRLKKHWEQLWTFLYHDDVPWNNNNAEAAVKAFALYRRGINGQVSQTGMNWYLPMLSIAQTCRYRNISFLDFLRRKAGLWQNVPPVALPAYLPFRQARLYARGLRFQRRVEWQAWSRSEKRPPFIPLMPDRVYKDMGWVNWADWLGQEFLSFEKARAYMRTLGLNNSKEYKEWLKSGKSPKTIPHEPHNIYKHTGWAGLSDWLGTGNIQNQKKKKVPYESARIYVQSLGIRSWQEYNEWSASGERPPNIPAAPNKAYPEFKSWGDFLGTGRIANQKKEFWDYGQATAFLAPLGIRSKTHFIALCKQGVIPEEIPRDPATHYKNEWNSYSGFLSKENSCSSLSINEKKETNHPPAAQEIIH